MVKSDPQRVEEGVSTSCILTVELDKVLLIIGSLLIWEGVVRRKKDKKDTYNR
jgi:hypothetical protein